MRARRSLGFTLLELLIVVAIIGVLATLILSGLASARRRTQIAVARTNISAIRSLDRQMADAQRALAAATSAYQLAVIRYKAGLSPQLQVLTADENRLGLRIADHLASLCEDPCAQEAIRYM